VIFLRIWNGFKRELCCADLRICLLAALATWVAGALSLLLSGAVGCYRLLCRPSISPGSVVWIILWMGFYLLLGLALGLVIGKCSICRTSLVRRGVVCWGLFLLCNLIWVILFFGAGFEVTSLLMILLAICFGCSTLAPFATDSLLAALLMMLCIWWELYSFLLTLLIILWN
jgi:tryptophan-rich sensory protein